MDSSDSDGVRKLCEALGALLKVKTNAYDVTARTLQLDARIQKGGQTTAHQLSQQAHAAIIAMLDQRDDSSGDRLFAWPFRLDHIWRAYRRDVLRPAGLPVGRRDLFHRIRRTSYSLVAATQGVEAATRHAAHKSDLSRFYLDRSHLEAPQPIDALPRLSMQSNNNSA